MDVLNLVSAWSKSSIVSPTLVIIKSLIMQGAEMNGTQLKETSRDAPEIVPLPPLVIGYSKVALSDKINSLQLPVYHDATRRQFLLKSSYRSRKMPTRGSFLVLRFSSHKLDADHT